MGFSANLRFLGAASVLSLAALTACGHGSALPGAAQPSTLGRIRTSSAPAKTSSSGIYVANYTGNTVTVFATNAHGNAKPIRTISGTLVGLSAPLRLTADKAGNLYVANRGYMDVTVYSPASRGNQAPLRTLADSAMNSPAAPLVDATGAAYVANCAGCVGSGVNAILHFPKRAASPDFSIVGSKTDLTAASSLGLDAAGNLYVGNSSGGAVTVYAKNAKGNAAPIRKLTPPGASDIQQVAYAKGALYVADVSGVYVYPSTAKGTAKPTTLFSDQQMSVTSPGAIFVTATAKNPTIYVADYTGNAVVIVQTSGTPPKLTLKSKTVIQGARTTMNGPTGIWLIP
jgi:hypothetical protein